VDRAEFQAAADYLYAVLGWDANGLTPGHELSHRVTTVNEELEKKLEGINR
jgi:hypothetical protein